MIRYFRSVDPERNRRRHYLLMVQRDLWGRLVVVRRWGRIGQPDWQGEQILTVDKPEDVDRVIKETLDRRRWHGYTPAKL